MTLIEVAEHVSLIDSTAEAMKAHPRSRSSGRQVAMLQQVLDLDGCVESDIGELSVQSARDAHGMSRPVEEIGSPK